MSAAAAAALVSRNAWSVKNLDRFIAKPPPAPPPAPAVAVPDAPALPPKRVLRPDPEAPKHKGISYVLVDMHSPGVTVRPLVQITGDANFNEVFFEDVKVPKKNLMGEKNQGWQVAITTLMFERSGIGGGAT